MLVVTPIVDALQPVQDQATAKGWRCLEHEILHICHLYLEPVTFALKKNLYLYSHIDKGIPSTCKGGT